MPFTFSPRAWVLLAGAGSAVILASALGSQFLGGLTPCPLCIWQRWPHVAAIVLAAIVLAAPAMIGHLQRVLAGLGALAMLGGAGLGVYHTGIERGWWPGPDTCSAADNVGAMSTDQLMTRIMDAPLVRCDEVLWELLGLSLASWNALASLALAGVWLLAATSRGSRQDSSSASQ